MADIYALGVTGWRLLGAPPMPGLADLEQAIRDGIWPDRDVWPLHVHGSLRRALRAAMHPDPARRPTRASALREALLVGRPVVNLAQTGPGSWAGADSTGTYTATCLRMGGDWVVSATRDKGSGPRRLTPDAHHAKRADPTRCVRDTLEAVATTGRAARG